MPTIPLLPFLDEMPVGVWVAKTPNGELAYANRRFGEILGMPAKDDQTAGTYSVDYSIHRRTGELYPDDQLPYSLAMARRAHVTVDDLVIHRGDGTRVYVRAEARPLFDEAGEMTHVIVAFVDITREVEAEDRLRQAQKMESIGTLAGGIAHDFNNLLAAMKLLSGMLRRLEADPTKLSYVNQLEQVVDSATQLTRALVGFARRGKNLSQRVSVNEVATRVATLMTHTVDRRITVRLALEAVTGDVVGDMSQLEQVAMNLAVNARDAMPTGGELTLRTRDVSTDAGPAVVFEVLDTGPGIPVELRTRVFEPYFTSKPASDTSGTGLGLAMVYGIVESHGGSVVVDDGEGAGARRGTCMRVTLAAAPPQSGRMVIAKAAPQIHRGTGTILVVDDEDSVRHASTRALRHMGYDVLEASSGDEALSLFREHRRRIKAVVLDMIMPEMDGKSTYLALRELEPGVRVLLTTGYALNDEAQRILDLAVPPHPAVAFVPKPYTIEGLSEALANVASR